MRPPNTQEKFFAERNGTVPGRIALFGLVLGTMGLLTMTACVQRPTVLQPLPVTSSASGEDIVVQVRPIESSFGSTDRRRYGVDLSAYYSAFLVVVENRSPFSVTVDPSTSTLEESSGKTWPVLFGDDLVYTYRGKGDPPVIELLPKVPVVVKRDMERIRSARFVGTTLDPGSRAEGVLLFEPVTKSGCGTMVLSVTGIEVADDPRGLEFRFPLSWCVDKPAVVIGGH